jgi:large subunit ribosomal protein L3
MAAPKRPRFGSLQFYPRKRAEKTIPSVNWNVVPGNGLLGFIAYKAGMASAVVKDDTPNSMTKGKKIVVPVTLLEVPNVKIFSVRFYNLGRVVKDIIVSNDKELKRIVKVPKQVHDLDKETPKEYDDIRTVIVSMPKQINLKKTPDIAEVALGGKKEEKLNFVKGLIGKEISVKEFLDKKELVDVRGLTTGKGLVGTVKRFGISLKSHKAEKGRRRPGSLGPWHPARVTYMTPQAGQLGMFTRVIYNLRVLGTGNISEKNINKGTGFKHYGKILGNYVVIKGSVQGPVKRQVLLTSAFRATKTQTKHKYELLEVIV